MQCADYPKYKLSLAAVALSFANLLSAGGGKVRLLAAQLPLPTKSGQVFIIDDWDNKVTENDMGSNYFSGNSGVTESVEGITEIALSNDSNSPVGGSLEVSFNFTGVPDEFAGYFTSLFGLTDTKVSLDGTGVEPPESTPLPGYFLDTQDIYRGFAAFVSRSVEQLRFDVRLESAEDITMKIELRDEPNDSNDFDVFTRRRITDTGQWHTISLTIPDDFNDSVTGGGNTAAFNWREVSTLSVIIERENIGAGISNPMSGRFLVDNLVFTDEDGEYPDLQQARDPCTDGLDPNYTNAFLDLIRATSSLYFLDWASTDSRTGGIIQDRSCYADLMSIGGVGFQLSSYVIDANAGYLTREAAAQRVKDILSVLHDRPQGPQRVGTAGYQGFFYHFLGIDGLRKQNFDWTATPDVNEALNTVELSTIDTTLTVAGAVTAAQYFDANDPVENQIRTLANEIYARVNWPFMLNQTAGPKYNQFFWGWKPLENRNGPAFEIPDSNGFGHYSGTPGYPGTADYYTDEGILIALLAMASPDPNHRLGREVWDAIIRDKQGGDFVKTYPGALFTYQFASCWLNTGRLGTDTHPNEPLNFYENSRKAIEATIAYATSNPKGRATLNEYRWGLSATEGPFDDYFAEAAPPVAISYDGNEPMAELFGSGPPMLLEAESGTGDWEEKQRGNASCGKTVWIHESNSCNITFDPNGTAKYRFKLCYSNDGATDTLDVRLDDVSIGECNTVDTRPPGGGPGSGWNEFVWVDINDINVAPGAHELTIYVKSADYYGVEVDCVNLVPQVVLRPLELGTVTNYAAAISIVHKPSEAIAAMWNNAANEDLNGDGAAELLHPRFGFADAFNLNIADAVIEGVVHPNETRILRGNGPWASYAGFAIDHGPMLIIIDNYLNNQFVPNLFMSYPGILSSLSELFRFGDLDDDNDVDFHDYAMFAVDWLETDCGTCNGADFTFDGEVGWLDLKQFTNNWLAGVD